MVRVVQAGRSHISSASTHPSPNILWLPVQGTPEIPAGLAKISALPPLVCRGSREAFSRRSSQPCGWPGCADRQGLRAGGDCGLANSRHPSPFGASDGVTHPMDDVSESKLGPVAGSPMTGVREVAARPTIAVTKWYQPHPPTGRILPTRARKSCHVVSFLLNSPSPRSSWDVPENEALKPGRVAVLCAAPTRPHQRASHAPPSDAAPSTPLPSPHG